jgi:flagellar biosynthesis protein FlhG
LRVQQIQSIHLNYDYVLIDTAPGLHDYVLHLNAVADECVLLITQDPSSFADAYALIKTLNHKYKMKDFQVICNLVEGKNGEHLFAKFAEVVEKFLTLHLSYLGTISEDAVLKKAQQMQRLVMRQGVTSQAQAQIQQISVQLIDKLNQKQGVDVYKTESTESSTKSIGLGGLFFPVSGHA